MKSLADFVLTFAVGFFIGVMFFAPVSTEPPAAPEDAIVITRADGVKCVGYVAAKPGFIGAPPRLWICGNDEPPWYDETGVKFPTRSLGELP